MFDFRTGEIYILVATTVIEVGVDVSLPRSRFVSTGTCEVAQADVESLWRGAQSWRRGVTARDA
jgi:Holliday junction resolvase-like predicted endonuclease